MMTRASLTSASKAYIVKVGGQSTMASPGSSTHRMSRSMSSSAPHPTCEAHQGTPECAASAVICPAHRHRIEGGQELLETHVS